MQGKGCTGSATRQFSWKTAPLTGKGKVDHRVLDIKLQLGDGHPELRNHGNSRQMSKIALFSYKTKRPKQQEISAIVRAVRQKKLSFVYFALLALSRLCLVSGWQSK